jgi:hypothetical protein
MGLKAVVSIADLLFGGYIPETWVTDYTGDIGYIYISLNSVCK